MPLPKRVDRTEDLMIMSPCGQIPPDLKTAVKYADRARYVSAAPAKAMTKLRRLIKLELEGPIPAWIGELRGLRTLQCGSGTKTLPPGLAKLPHLTNLHLDGSDLRSLAGLETLKALENLTIGDTPVGRDPAAIAAAIARIPGARAMGYLTGISVDREPSPAPKDRKKLAAALRGDTLPDSSDLRKVDLVGETFEDLYVNHDLRGAKLANTTWRRCDFDLARLAGADLTGARFDDCYFSPMLGDGGNLARVKARGLEIAWCGGELGFAGADLRDAKLYLESDTTLDLEKANAQGLVLVTSFCSEKEHQFEMKRADLRGAQVTIDVTPDRRAEIKKKRGSRFKWKQDHFKGAKLDKTTVVTYAPLDASAPTSGGVDPKGKAATTYGKIFAPNAGLWLIAADAADAATWRGAVDENDRKDDFQRALVAKDGPIDLGGGKRGLRLTIGYRSGWSDVWQVPGGIMLIDTAMSIDRKEATPELALRVAQWPVPAKRRTIGTLTIHSGVLLLMLPFNSGALTPAELAKGKKSYVNLEKHDYDRVLVPMKNGTYVVTEAPFGARDGFEDEIGEYGLATRIERR
jgi:uncharacterized protein YjbI with pentapeptide repeats